MQLYLFFFNLLMIHETIIILNQISPYIAYTSAAYKRYPMLFWRNNFLFWAFCVFIPYFIWTIFPNKYFQKLGVWKKCKKGAWPYRGLSTEDGGSKLLCSMN